MIGGGNGIFGLSDWVVLLKMVAFVSDLDDGGDTITECSLAGCEFESEETIETPESESVSEGSGKVDSARCLVVVGDNSGGGEEAVLQTFLELLSGGVRFLLEPALRPAHGLLVLI